MTPVKKTKIDGTVKAASAAKSVKAEKEEVKAASPVAEKAAKKAAPAKKAATKKSAAAEPAHTAAAPEATVTIEYQGGKVQARTVLDRALSAYKEAHEGVEVKTIDLYIQPELGIAYYVVNGEGSEDFKVTL